MQNDFGVSGRLENRTFALELVAQDIGVDQIAVVRDRHLTADAIDHERLRVLHRARAGGRITRVPDGAATFELLELSLTENLRDKPHVLVNQERRARTVAGHDSRALLAAMLEREKSVIGQDRGVGMAEYAKKSALMLRINVALPG